MRAVSVFGDVVVCTPTVRPRAAIFEAARAEWRRYGVEPIARVQPDDWPLSNASQRRNADLVLHDALTARPDAGFILMAEDDVLLGPELDLWLPGLKLLGAPVSLFVHRWHLYPNEIRRLRGRPCPERIVRLRPLQAWWGAIAVLLPRPLAEATLAWRSERVAWDIHLRAFLLAHGIPLLAPVPNPVQHLGAPTSIGGNTGEGHSVTFGLPSDRSGISPPVGIDWCPYGDWDPDPRAS
jgi:hypothetical protein